MSAVNRDQLSRNGDDDDAQRHTFSSNESLSELYTISHRVCQVLMPVSLCSIYVTLLVKLSTNHVTKSESIMERAWLRLGLITSTQDEHAVGKAMLGSLYLVMIFLALIVAITLVVLFVLHMEWYSCLSYYFYLPSLLIMSVLTPAYLRVIANSLDWLSIDIVTLALLTWNFTALGMMSIFGLYASGPLIIGQLYLIHNSSLVAVLVVNFLPGWAPWMLLGFLVFWDLFSVMAPFGPLNLIISIADKKGIADMPGLVYSTNMHPRNKEQGQVESVQVSQQQPEPDQQEAGQTVACDEFMDAERSLDEIPNSATTTKKIESSETSKTSKSKTIEERGVSIGLGDFIFYGLLIGLTSKGQEHREFYTTLATFNSILVGLVMTIAILAYTRRTLPALPISIALGMIMAALSFQFVPNLADSFAHQQIFI